MASVCNHQSAAGVDHFTNGLGNPSDLILFVINVHTQKDNPMDC